MTDLLFLGCVSKNQNTITKDFFLKENKSVDFSNWKGWTISYGSGKYIAEFKSDSTKELKRLIFFTKNNSTIIRLSTNDSLSGFITIDKLINNTLWKNQYQQMKIEELKSHIDFVIKYNIELADYLNNPKKIIFKSNNDNFDLIYLYNPNDSILLRDMFKSININWYEFK